MFVLLLVLATLMYRTRLRNEDYRSDLTLWAPDDLVLAYTMLAGNAIYHARFDEAVGVLQEMLDAPTQESRYASLGEKRAEALSALGFVHARQDRLDEAERFLGEALVLNPSFATAENNLGVVRMLRDDRSGGRNHCLRAVQLDPRLAAAHYNYALAILSLGQDKDEAAAHLTRADELLPAPARLGERTRRDLIQADLRNFRFSATLAIPDTEFTIAVALALVPIPRSAP